MDSDNPDIPARDGGSTQPGRDEENLQNARLRARDRRTRRLSALEFCGR